MNYQKIRIGNIISPTGIQNYGYDGTNPQNLNINNYIYYFDDNGIMVTGQHIINGKIYNFDTTAGATEGRLLY